MRKSLLVGTMLTLSACSLFETPAPVVGPPGPPGPPGPVAPVVSPASVANDISLIANGIANAINNPSVQSLIPPATLPKVQQAVADLQSLSSQIAADPSAQLTKANVTQIESLVNDIVADVSGLPLPAPWPTILTAAQVLLPTVEAAVGIVVPASAHHGGMSTATARGHLKTGH